MPLKNGSVILNFEEEERILLQDQQEVPITISNEPASRKSKAQLTRMACERLSDVRIGVMCRRSRLQFAVGCMPKWTETCSRLCRQDSGRLLFQSRMNWPTSCSCA